MEKQYISFSGKRKKIGHDKWENVEIIILADSILSATFVDNRDNYPCEHCIKRDQCDEGNLQVPLECEWEYECNELADYIADDSINQSFIDIVTHDYAYRIEIENQWEDDLNWYKDVFKIIKNRKTVDVDAFIAEKQEEKEKADEARHLAWEIAQFKRAIRKREKCTYDCKAKQSDGTCYLGFECVNGKPQEPCHTCNSKRLLQHDKDFIDKHILSRFDVTK